MALFDGLRHGQYMGVPSAGVPKFTNMADYIQFIPKSPEAIEGAGEVEKATHQHRTGMAMLNQQIAQIQAQKSAVKANRTLDNYEENTSEYARLVGLESQLKLNQMSYLNAAEPVKDDVDKIIENQKAASPGSFIINDQGDVLVDLTKTGLNEEAIAYALEGRETPSMGARQAEQRLVDYYTSQKDHEGKPLMTEDEARKQISLVLSGSMITYNDQYGLLDNYTGLDANGMPMVSTEHYQGVGTGQQPYLDAVSEIKTMAGYLLNQITEEKPTDSSGPYSAMGAVFTDDLSRFTSESTKRNVLNLNASIKALLSNTSPEVERSLREQYYDRLSSSRLDKTSFFFDPLNETVKKDKEGKEYYSLGFSSDETDPSNYFNFHTKFVKDSSGDYIAEEKDKEGKITEVKYDPEKHDISDIKVDLKTWEEKEQGFQQWKRMKVIQDVMPSLDLETKVIDKSERKRSAASRGNEPKGIELSSIDSVLSEVTPGDPVKVRMQSSSNDRSSTINVPVKVWADGNLGKELSDIQERTISGNKVKQVSLGGEMTGLILMDTGHGLAAYDASILNMSDGLELPIVYTDNTITSEFPVLTNRLLRETVNNKFVENFFFENEDLVTEISDLKDKLNTHASYYRDNSSRFLSDMLEVLIDMDPSNLNQDAFDVLMDDVISNGYKYQIPGNAIILNDDGSINEHELIKIARQIDSVGYSDETGSPRGTRYYESLIRDLADEIQLIYAVGDMSRALSTNQPQATKTGKIGGIGSFKNDEFNYYYRPNVSFLNLFESKDGLNDDDTKFDIRSIFPKSAVDQRLGTVAPDGTDISNPTKFKKVHVLMSKEQRMEFAKKGTFVNKGADLTISTEDLGYAVDQDDKGSRYNRKDIEKMWMTDLKDLPLSMEELIKLPIPQAAKKNNFNQNFKLSNDYAVTTIYIPIRADGGSHSNVVEKNFDYNNINPRYQE